MSEENEKTINHYRGAIILRRYQSKSDPAKSFMLAKARGQDLSVPGALDETRYDVKIAGNAATFPKEEGIYRLEFDGEAWVDRRKEVKYPTIWIKPSGAFKCDKSKDLPTFENKK